MLGDVHYGWLIIFSEQGYEIKAKEKIFWHEICILWNTILDLSRKKLLNNYSGFSTNKKE